IVVRDRNRHGAASGLGRGPSKKAAWRERQAGAERGGGEGERRRTDRARLRKLRGERDTGGSGRVGCKDDRDCLAEAQRVLNCSGAAIFVRDRHGNRYAAYFVCNPVKEALRRERQTGRQRTAGEAERRR